MVKPSKNPVLSNISALPAGSCPPAPAAMSAQLARPLRQRHADAGRPWRAAGAALDPDVARVDVALKGVAPDPSASRIWGDGRTFGGGVEPAAGDAVGTDGVPPSSDVPSPPHRP
eukprot:2327630-Pyramimonas_sp.AAC.1